MSLDGWDSIVVFLGDLRGMIEAACHVAEWLRSYGSILRQLNMGNGSSKYCVTFNVSFVVV
jgi:hypothetical protein